MPALARGRPGLARRHPRHADGRGRPRPARLPARPSGPARARAALMPTARVARREQLPARPRAGGPAPRGWRRPPSAAARRSAPSWPRSPPPGRRPSGKSPATTLASGRPMRSTSSTSAPNGDAGRQRQLLRHAGEARRPAHGLGVDIGIGDRVDAGEFERLEEAADQQHGEHHGMRRAGGEQRDRRRGTGCSPRALVTSTRLKPKRRMIGAAVVFMAMAPTALAKVSSPDWSAVRPKPSWKNSGRRNGMAPTPMR